MTRYALAALLAAALPLSSHAGTNAQTRALAAPQPDAMSQVTDATSISSESERAALIARTKAEMASSGKTFVWQPLLRDGKTIAAIEYWGAARPPATHTAEDEYFTVLDGGGTMVTGGTMVKAQLSRPGLVEGERIDHGTSRALHKGDVVLIPRGVPHWFGIPSGQVMVLLGVKIPVSAPQQ
ncbi:MAG: cupin domain-containing protein [Sphingomonadales bacterium]|nr:cupin domain-containing protein [Sphingomonadales bacterium]MDE2171815.1 cupin domain-containing protein [Sphingomonadales bacterium]